MLQAGRTREPRMNPHLFAAYCLAVVILLLIPGPVVTLVVANSLSHGRRSGLATVAGASLGNAILLGGTAVGLIAFFRLLSEVFEIVRWVGAAYLIWLGVKAWRTQVAKEGTLAPAAARSARAVLLQGFLIAITNPKAIFFYIAFLPQFIDPHLPAGRQLLLMIATMIVMGVLTDTSYALLSARARDWFTVPKRRRLQNRISGTLLIGVGCGLLVARRRS
jgi:threonine/homoserine/homoserine lactone efflux protein